MIRLTDQELETLLDDVESDHAERKESFNSPGGPYGNVTARNFGRPGVTDYRNPNIGDALKTLGFIQAFGRGIAVAKKAMEENGNPALEFEINSSAVVCTLRGKS